MKALAARPSTAETIARSDADLLGAITGDDLSALGALYDRHASSVWRVVRRVTGRPDDVDDIVHATFLKVPRLASSFDGRDSARNWLIGIGVRTALHHLRAGYRVRNLVARLTRADRGVDGLDPERVSAARADVATLERAVALLAPSKRAVFLMVESEGLSHAEVAVALEIPVATVRTRLFHAKDELRHALGLVEAP